MIYRNFVTNVLLVAFVLSLSPPSAAQVFSLKGKVLLPYEENGKFGYKDIEGQVVIKPVYDDAKRFNDGLAAVKKNGKWGYISRDNKEVVKFKYDYVEPFTKNNMVVKGGGAAQFVIFKENAASGIQMDSIKRVGPSFALLDAKPIHDNVGAARLLEGWKLINEAGEPISNELFRNVGVYSEGVIPVQKTNTWTYITIPDYKAIFEDTHFANAQEFSEGLAAVQLMSAGNDRKPFIYINKTGDTAFEGQYIGAMPFSEGLAAVKSSKENLWGYIDKKGTWVIPPMFENASPFQNSVAEVIESSSSMRFYIHKNGDAIFRASTVASQAYAGLETVLVNVTSQPEGASIYFVPSGVKSLYPDIYQTPAKMKLYECTKRASFKLYSINQKAYFVVAQWPDGKIKDLYYKTNAQNADISLIKP